MKPTPLRRALSSLRCALSRRQLSSSPAARDPTRHRLPLPSFDTHVTFTREGPQLSEAKHILCMWHGAPGSTFDWRYVAPCLSDDVAIIRLELPGHGESPRGASLDADPTSPNMERALLASIRGVAEAEGWDAKQPLDVFALAHSLGSLEALGLCDPAAELEQRTSDTCTLVRFVGCGLVSPFGLRPHRAIKMIAKRDDGETFPLLRPVLRSAALEVLLSPIVRFLSVNMMGFGARASASELFWMIKRAAASDYGRVRAIYGRMRDARTPLLLCYGTEDKLMERAIHDEVAQHLNMPVREVVSTGQDGGNGVGVGDQDDAGDRPGEGPTQRAVVFVGASHYAIRSHPQQLADAIEEWMDAVCTPPSRSTGT